VYDYTATTQVRDHRSMCRRLSANTTENRNRWKPLPYEELAIVRAMIIAPILLSFLNSLQKGDLLTTETTEITETKDNFIFHWT